jgi:RNA polymerase sigma-70 factor (ECF subfamily)
MSDTPSDHRFPPTHWSIVARLKSSSRAESEAAVDAICTAYRFPLYSYLRSTGLKHEDAEDVLHGFFEKLLRRDSLAQVDQQKGRLRTFLLVSLSRYLSNWRRGEIRRQQRVQAEPDFWQVDESRYRMEQPASGLTPETEYDRRWATELIDHVRQRLASRYERSGKSTLHAALAPFLVKDSAAAVTLQEVAGTLGFTDTALRVALHRLRKEFRHLLLEEVSRTLDDGEDPQAEIRHLLAVFN